MNKVIDFLYGATFKYFEKLWGKSSNIVPFNVTLALTLSTFCFFTTILLTLSLLSKGELLFLFSRTYIIVGLLGVLAFFYFRYERKERYKKILSWYDSECRGKKFHFLKLTLVFVYNFGSIIFFIVLAILNTLERS